MKRFWLLLLTFAAVYFLAPWLAYQTLHWAVPGYSGAAGLVAIWLAYSLLRRVFGERLPQV